ncbi:MAG: hypothetical protein JWQ33_2336 [Ramlibacter sp.]|nr:hypothetical protein [Ramlibacter sp.]
MASRTFEQAHQSRTSLSGTWKLAAGRAITLQPRERGLLRIAHGSVWITADGPHPGPANDQGDRFMGAGERLPLLRGQRLVIEALDATQPAYFSWDPSAQPGAVRLVELVQPARDLRLAVVLGLGAAGRLLVALAAVGWRLVLRDRPCLAERALSAHSSASCAHGAMS